MKQYKPIVGMEIHVELKTKSKMFCGCKNDPFHASKPNIYTCPVCLGMPGGLPVPNKKAIEWTILLGLALGCEINRMSKFDRKNYFYPDLAKGYQISQYDRPLCVNGILRLSEGNVRIHRVHLEEDTGKLQHTSIDNKKVTLVDFNRSGVPLVEIVTEPDIHSGEQAKSFLKKLHHIITELGISDAEMEKGSMRLEPNISVKEIAAPAPPPRNDKYIEVKDLPKYKVEVKNINSFNYVKKAIDFETKRHIEIIERGEFPKQETRGWNEDKGITFSQRSKEQAEDYRYFPDPDIPPLRFTDADIDALRKQLPELPDQKIARFMDTYGLTEQTVTVLVADKATAILYEAAVAIGKVKGLAPKQIANWIVNKQVDSSATSPKTLVQQLLNATLVVEIADDEIRASIAQVLTANPKAVADYKSGKETVLMFLFGQTMKALQGKGDKATIQKLLAESLQ